LLIRGIFTSRFSSGGAVVECYGGDCGVWVSLSHDKRGFGAFHGYRP